MNDLLEKIGIELPIVQAPMAGVSTPALAAAVSNAGGLGSIGVGAATAEVAREMIREVQNETECPFNVNVFCHRPAVPDGDREAGWLERLAPVFTRYGAEPPRQLREIYRSFVEDDAMLAVLVEERPKVVSFHFGLPSRERIDTLHAAGIVLLATATNLAEGRAVASAGVDVVVAQGYEAGGHTGEIATMVLVPEVVDAVAPAPVLAAGGIGSGRQIAAALALGAQGVWLGSLWLTTAEGGSSPAVLQSYLDATSADTVRSRCYTGKPARMVRNAWTDAWTDSNGPGALGMPLQNILTSEANARIVRSGRTDLAFAPVGQIVGRMNEVRPVRDVMFQLVEEYIETVERLEAGVQA
jgi:nitronate monooxygenase